MIQKNDYPLSLDISLIYVIHHIFRYETHQEGLRHCTYLLKMSNNHTPFTSQIKYNLDILSIAIHNTALSIIVTTIERILSEIECLKFKYERVPYRSNGKETATFILEYGTLPKIRTLSIEQRTYYQIFSGIIFDACDMALLRFPHNAEYSPEYDLDNLPGPLTMRRSWCMIDINILFNQPQAPDAIVLEFFRISGDRHTRHWIFKYVKNRLEKELQNLMHHIEYLSLIEGCADATGHIAFYLFDAYVARDICSYIGTPKISYIFN